MEILLGMGRKYCGKRRKCWLPAFSPFPTMFSKGFSSGVVKSSHCVVRVNPLADWSKLRQIADNILKCI